MSTVRDHNLATLIAMNHISDPGDGRFDGKMLYTVYDDGEVTLQKAGYLWGCRTEHVIEFGTPSKKLLSRRAVLGQLSNKEFST